MKVKDINGVEYDAYQFPKGEDGQPGKLDEAACRAAGLVVLNEQVTASGGGMRVSKRDWGVKHVQEQPLRPGDWVLTPVNPAPVPFVVLDREYVARYTPVEPEPAT
jgi:hypothetical protein